jgi:hypothetical protein
MKPAIKVVLNNALLQGSLLNQISPQSTSYVLKKDQIERLIVLYNPVATFEKPKYSIRITQKFIGPEFKGQ